MFSLEVCLDGDVAEMDSMVGLGFRRFGRGDIGGEVADMSFQFQCEVSRFQGVRIRRREFK